MRDKEIFAGQLKLRFWTSIIPNITQYQLLSDDMREYFNSAELFVDVHNNNVGNSLSNNEPKGNGKDFRLFPGVLSCYSTSEDEVEEAGGMTDDMLKTVSNAFAQPRRYNGAFSWETDSDEDENTINVAVNQAEHQEDEGENHLKEVTNAFQSVLKFKDDNDEVRNNEMSLTDVMKRLRDPKVLSDISCFDKLPGGIRLFMSGMPFFKKLFDEQEQNLVQQDEPPIANLSEPSSLGVPSYSSDSLGNSNKARPSSSIASDKQSSSSSTTSGDVSLFSTKTNPVRNLRSSSSSSQGSTSTEYAKRAAAMAKLPKSAPVASPVSRKPRSKKQQLGEGAAYNPRMKNWMADFGSKKRRRDSSSPES